MDIEKAERLIDKVHLYLSKDDPDWIEEALRNDKMPKGAKEAVEAVLRANGLADMGPDEKHELAEHWTELGSADLARFLVSEEEVINKHMESGDGD